MDDTNGARVIDEERARKLAARARQLDAVELLLWYLQPLELSASKQKPIYSVDARGRAHSEPHATSSPESLVPAERDNSIPRAAANVISPHARHYVAAHLSKRVAFELDASVSGGGGNQTAYLIIHKLEPSDAGAYRCRVDYRYARTRYQVIQLNVICELFGWLAGRPVPLSILRQAARARNR